MTQYTHMTDMTHVTAIDLQRAMHRRLHRDVQGHKVVLGRCYRKIKRVAGIDETSCIYEIPEFVVGVPPFEMSKAVSHVIHDLERNGYEVAYMFPRSLLISWDLEVRRLQPAPAPAPVPYLQTHVSSQIPSVSSDPISLRRPSIPTSHRPISDFQPSRRFLLNSN